VDYFHKTANPRTYNSMHLKFKILCIYCFEYIYQRRDLWCYSWLEQYAKRRKVIGLISNELMDSSIYLNIYLCGVDPVALLTYTSTRAIQKVTSSELLTKQRIRKKLN
jgi:hypothetical protein